jgi:hypothetical protein
MEGKVAILADERQPLVGTVLGAGMPTHRAGLTAIVGINLDLQGFSPPQATPLQSVVRRLGL